MPIGRLEKRTTPDNVADVLREAILDGSLKSGSQLRETHIAADLGVSRAPLREALRRLEEEGLIVKIPFQGAYVAEISPQAVDEIASLRKVLEPYAAERGLKMLQTTHLEYLRGLIKKMAEAADAHDVQLSTDSHLAFHRALYEAAENEQLLGLWRGWESQLRLFLAADIRSFDDPMQVADAHAVLMSIIEAGDMKALRRELSKHIHGSKGKPARSTKATS